MVGINPHGVKLTKPPQTAADMMTLFSMIASPEAAKKTVELQKEWEEAFAANARQLEELLEGRSLADARARANSMSAQVRAALREAEERAGSTVEDAHKEAKKRVAHAQQQADRLTASAEKIEAEAKKRLEAAAAAEKKLAEERRAFELDKAETLALAGNVEKTRIETLAQQAKNVRNAKRLVALAAALGEDIE